MITKAATILNSDPNKDPGTKDRLPILFPRRLMIILAIALTLSSCDPQEKCNRYSKEVIELTAALKQESQDYEDVGIQENIQQDLKKKGADATINQDIRYSHKRAEDQDKKIEKTKRELSIAQRNLKEAEEELAKKEAIKKEKEEEIRKENSQRLNPHKYDYIKEEFKRNE